MSTHEETANVQANAPADRTSDLPVWVVGVDGSENSRHAALWAVEHAASRASEVRFVHAWHVLATAAYPIGASAMATQLSDDLEGVAVDTVNDMVERFRPSAKVPLVGIATCGGAARVLLEATPSDGLLIVGSRGRGGFARLVLGSTSSQVATHALTPCVVVPHDAPVRTAQHIVVAVDGSENSLAALDFAIDFAGAGARVEAAMVWETALVPTPMGAADLEWPPLSPAAKSAEERFVELVEQRASSRDDITLESVFVEGAARPELQRFSEAADLLVMGERGHGAIGAALLGSVSTWLLHHVHVPIVVVPSGDGADEQSDE